MQDKKIKSAVLGELGRILCFMVYYIILIAIGLALFFAGMAQLLYYLVFLLPDVAGYSIRLVVLLLLASLVIVFITTTLSIYLVKPLFSFKKAEKETRIEVKETDCPKLFAVIREVAQKTRCKMPKHVYLTPDVNACVFFNTSFWSIFFPVRKNLEIGLGLFDGMSVEEIKSVIAHEFGHFSQNSMRVGETVYITNTILYNLICPNDSIDEELDSSATSDIGVVRIYGNITRWIRNGIKRLTLLVYKFVQKGNLKLSRHMEYDADDIACQAVGSATFISALCKIEVLSKKDRFLQEFVMKLVDKGEIVSNFFVCKEMAYNSFEKKNIMVVRYDEPLNRPSPYSYESLSKVRIKDVWESHPSLEDRIINARRNTDAGDNQSKAEPAWGLIPEASARRVSGRFIRLFKSAIKKPVQPITDEQFEEWIQKELENNYIDGRLSPFFGRVPYKFDIDEVREIPSESPLTEANAIKIERLAAGQNDWDLLNRVRSGEIDVREVQYDGKVYKRNRLPYDKLKLELDALYEEVLGIYADIYAYMMSKCDEEQGQVLRNAYVALFWANEHIQNLYELYNRLLKVHHDAWWAETDYHRTFLTECEQYVNSVLSEFDINSADGITDIEEAVTYLKDYMAMEHSPITNVKIEVVEEILKTTGALYSVMGVILGKSNRTICETASGMWTGEGV